MSHRLGKKIQGSLYLLPTLRLIWNSSPGWTIGNIVLLIIQAILPLCSLYLTKLIIDSVSAGSSTNQDTSLNEIVTLMAFFGAITLLTLLCNSLSEVVDTAHCEKLNIYMKEIINAKSVEVDLEFYENPQYQDTLQRAQDEGSYRPVELLDDLLSTLHHGISLITMTGFLLSLHWGIAGFLFIAVIPGGLIRIKYAHVLYDWERKRTEMQRQSYYLRSLLTRESSAKEIRLFNLGTFFQQRFKKLREKIYQEKIAIAKRQSMTSFAAQLILATLMLTAYSFIIYRTFQGFLSVGDLVIYHELLKRAQGAFRGLASDLSNLYDNNLFLANLYEFLEMKPKIVEPSQPLLVPQPIKQGIVFNNVSFQYNTTTRQALKNIKLTIRPGETVALVGENGSGKTTLIKLLCRLYDPTAGSITIDGIDLRQFKITDLRKQISVIFQDYVKYDFTARENIWLGNIDLPPSHDHIHRAALRSGADEVIKSLPLKYDNVLGKRFDKGEQLSIGQWQKVALARAFLRDSQVIILDEPSSALDPKAEYKIFQKFRELLQHQTAILISHRLSTVKMADWIYVLDRGSIIESGTHQQLIRLGGTYARMFETQAKNYK